jgi:TIR domain/Interferon-induced transmembrane protein
MKLFFSYARPDRPRVESLVTRLRQAGIDVWLDSDLVGGWPWWDKILGQIRSCDVVVAAVSRASIDSEACHSERAYAARLGKPILPLALERVPTGLFPADIAPIQVVDYTRRDEGAALKLASAIFAYPQGKALPYPLPAPPDMPQTRFGDLNDLIRKRTLTREEQLGILVRLGEALGSSSTPDDRKVAAEMLGVMAQRQDLYEAAARQIDTLQAQVHGGRRKKPPSGGTSQQSRPTGAPGAVNVHRGMAITTAVISFVGILLAPIGIAALVYYNQAKERRDLGDIAGARKASSRVVTAFWIAVAIWVVIIIIEIAVSASHGGSNGAAMIISPVQR